MSTKPATRMDAAPFQRGNAPKTEPDWADLQHATWIPRLDATATSVLNQVYRARPPTVLDIHGVRCSLYWKFQRRARPKERKYRFTLGQQEAYLALDQFAESILMGGERHAGLLPRELRYLLVAEALAPLVQHVEALSGSRFEWDPPEADEATLCVFDVERAAQFRVLRRDRPASCGGFIQFSDSAAMESLAALVAGGRSLAGQQSALDWLRFPLACRIGSTRMSLREMRGIRSGDIISVDDWRGSESGLFVTMEVQGKPGVEIMALAEGARITVQHWSENMQIGDSPSSRTDADPSSLPPDRLGGLEVPLRFEIGDLSVALADLKNVQPGYVFELPQPLARGVVRILAHGNLVGTGYLVAVGERLGVRVSEFLPAENE